LRSISCLREAIERDPRNFMPRIELASTYIDIGLDDQAEQLLLELEDAPGVWGAFRHEILANLHVYRGETQAAREIADSILQDDAVSPRARIYLDLIFAEAQEKDKLPALRERLESLMSVTNPYDRDAPEIATSNRASVAPSLIKVYFALGDHDRAERLMDALDSFILKRNASGHPISIGEWRQTKAEIHLWRGDVEAALDVLEPLPDTFRYHSWYIEHDPDLEQLHDEPRFAALVTRIDDFMRQDRDAVLGAGDDLPACVQR
jgi:tetratricopeptide (TPR) repeat protein